jgi:hypothetical protein
MPPHAANTGIVAASRLQAMIGNRDYGGEIAEMRVQVGMIAPAVRSVVPETMWGEIVAKVEQLEQHSGVLDVEDDGFDADDPHDPAEFLDRDDDEF